jgi:hypothetical protein
VLLDSKAANKRKIAIDRNVSDSNANAKNRVASTVVASMRAANREVANKADDKPCPVKLTSGGRRLPPLLF